jgi:hypothetical protein
LDSTALYDAVATMDTVTLVRSAIRGLLRVCDADTEVELRGLLARDDDYRAAGKPVCDYEDPQARARLIDALARDALALLAALEGRELAEPVAEAVALLAAVVGQDLEQGEDGRFRIARRVAKDRVISTVDPQARHGHKTSARGFDGYKGHVAIDPDSELITATEVAAANIGDAAVAQDLLADDLPSGRDDQPPEPEPEPDGDQRLIVYGDSGYGAGALIERLEQARVEIRCKVQAATAPAGHFTIEDFEIDLHAGTVRCPAGQSAPLWKLKDGQMARFGAACQGCPLAVRCTSSPAGRSIRLTIHHAALTRARARQTDTAWKADYKAARPIVERKQAHMMRRRHGGRRARLRGQTKIHADFSLLAAAVNLARLAILGLTSRAGGWATA